MALGLNSSVLRRTDPGEGPMFATRCSAISLIRAVVILLLLASGKPLLAQFGPAFIPFDHPGNGNGNEDLGVARMHTDPELERMFRRADGYVELGRYDLATLLWQEVLDNAGDLLISRDGRIYRSVASQIERTIRSLPPEALRAYRLAADGSAMATLTNAVEGNEEDALAEVERRFFLSAHGDKTTFRLGCLALDRFDFVEASRLFLKLLNEYPDSDIPRSEVLLRLAIISGRLGDADSAEQHYAAFDRALRAEGGDFPDRVMELVQADIARADAGMLSQIASDEWLVELGTASRTGRMRSITAMQEAHSLGLTWEKSFSAVPFPGIDEYIRQLSNHWGERSTILGSLPIESRDIRRQWSRGGGVPSGQMLFAGGLAYYKTPTQLACVDMATGEPKWEGRINTFTIDAQTQLYLTRSMFGQSNSTSLIDLFTLGDRVNGGMAIDGDSLFTIEGNLGTQANRHAAAQHRSYTETPIRARQNWIAAYHRSNGKFRWRFPTENVDIEWNDRSFLAPPTPYAKALLVPVAEKGSLWLYAIHQDGGKTLWRTYLCDEPPGSSSPWATIGVAVDGGEAYVSTGVGLVFAVDARSGAIRWAYCYPRAGSPSHGFQRGFGGAPAVIHEFDNWTDDTVIPFGRTLLIMASDSDRILAIDRRTCKLLWESPIDSLDDSTRYCLGVAGRSLYVAGPGVVRRFDITGPSGKPSGRFVWNLSLESLGDSFGRGVLTDDAIYLPVKDSVVQIDLETGKTVGRLGVDQPMGGENENATPLPFGNLYSDGERIFVVSPGHVAALTPLKETDDDEE